MMDRYFKRKLPPNFEEKEDGLRQNDVKIDLPELPTDPGLRPRISDYNVYIQDQVRKAYLQRGPCQPRDHNFPFRKFGEMQRRFVPSWFIEYPTWLEYSIAKDAAFCLCCYLFKPQNGDQGGGDYFLGKGFSNWKKKERFLKHVGGHNSSHNQAWSKCEELMKQNQRIQACFSKPMLNAAIDCVRFLLQQGLAFCYEDEVQDPFDQDIFQDSSSQGVFQEKFQGHFLELLRFLADHNENIKALSLKNSPEKLKFTSPEIQKDIVSAASTETVNVVVREMGDSLFSVLIDECCDLSAEEQMIVIIRFVDKKGQVAERLIGLEHVSSITAFSFKIEIDILFSRFGLSLSKLRGQSYNGVSIMRDEFNGLKTLILKESESAYYVHCFSQQLQLIIVALAKNYYEFNSLFKAVDKLVKHVRATCKNPDVIQEKQTLVVQALNGGELSSGQVLNQETKRFGSACWCSHYDTLVSIITMYRNIIDVLEYIEDDGSTSKKRFEANNLLELMLSFNFVFSMHLMKDILGNMYELLRVLQKKDQDIVNVVRLVGLSKQGLQMMREGGWDSFLDQVFSFCGKYDIDVPNMDDILSTHGRRKTQEITKLNYYRGELFYSVLDMQLQELNNRFDKTNIELLLCLACLSPNDSFAAFNKEKLIRFAEFYPKDFSAIELLALESQLETYILDMRSSAEFDELKGIGDLAKKLVETKKDKVYFLVYKLITLALILPIATPTVERAFSAMNFVKTELRNEIGDQWIKDNLIVYIEQDVFRSIENNAIIERFQNMKMF